MNQESFVCCFILASMCTQDFSEANEVHVKPPLACHYARLKRTSNWVNWRRKTPLTSLPTLMVRPVPRTRNVRPLRLPPRARLISGALLWTMIYILKHSPSGRCLYRDWLGAWCYVGEQYDNNSKKVTCTNGIVGLCSVYVVYSRQFLTNTRYRLPC